MDTSVLIGRLLSAVYVVVGLGIVLRPAHYRKMVVGFTESAAVLYIGGLLALIVGLLITTFHNVWTGSWVVLLTIIGWLACVKGVLILVLPDLMTGTWTKLLGSPRAMRVWGSVALIFGLVIAWFSYCAACGQQPV